jgi:hypothetical protein
LSLGFEQQAQVHELDRALAENCGAGSLQPAFRDLEPAGVCGDRRVLPKALLDGMAKARNDLSLVGHARPAPDRLRVGHPQHICHQGAKQASQRQRAAGRRPLELAQQHLAEPGNLGRPDDAPVQFQHRGSGKQLEEPWSPAGKVIRDANGKRDDQPLGAFLERKRMDATRRYHDCSRGPKTRAAAI